MTTKLRPISVSGGSRQRIWTILREAKRPLPAREIAKRAECAHQTAWGYLGGLKAHDYAENNDDGWVLKNDTGTRSPSVNLNSGAFHDWNLAPSVSKKDLEKAWRQSDLSLNAFGQEVGLGAFNGDRIKHMISGQRPISARVEAWLLRQKQKRQGLRRTAGAQPIKRG